MDEDSTLPWWPFAAAAAIAVVGVLAAVFWPHGDVSLHLADRGSAPTGATVADVAADAPYRFLVAPLCVRHGTVSITGVSVHDPDGTTEVADWALATSVPSGLRAGDAGRADALPGFAQRQVKASCTAPQQLAVSVRRVSGSRGTADAFEVDSTSGTVIVPFAVQLCEHACPTS